LSRRFSRNTLRYQLPMACMLLMSVKQVLGPSRDLLPSAPLWRRWHFWVLRSLRESAANQAAPNPGPFVGVYAKLAQGNCVPEAAQPRLGSTRGHPNHDPRPGQKNGPARTSPAQPPASSPPTTTPCWMRSCGAAGVLAGETWPWITDRSPGWPAFAAIPRSLQCGNWSS
jgi:hypothetical protein